MFKHTHSSTDFNRGGIKVVRNQRGYVLPGSPAVRSKARAGTFEPDAVVALRTWAHRMSIGFCNHYRDRTTVPKALVQVYKAVPVLRTARDSHCEYPEYQVCSPVSHRRILGIAPTTLVHVRFVGTANAVSLTPTTALLVEVVRRRVCLRGTVGGGVILQSGSLTTSTLCSLEPHPSPPWATFEAWFSASHVPLAQKHNTRGHFSHMAAVKGLGSQQWPAGYWRSSQAEESLVFKSLIRRYLT